jgi:adenylosuccinate lyase
VQGLAMQAWEKKKNFEELIMNDREIRKTLTQAEIKACFDLIYYLRRVDYIYKRVFAKR